MAAKTLKTWFYEGDAYVEPKEAARFLDMSYKTLLAHITAGKLPVVQIESRQLIQIDVLHTYAASRRPRQRRQSAERWI